ncbi:unnamed protein product [Cuscuta campestris]|uniref:Uncharacterized protein n=1 Tax=Cuscuta campestris TaxID=132261 RepID=A0A484MPK4_9ASTE|nr:unnamed protein product [Cuscuta campestris]
MSLSRGSGSAWLPEPSREDERSAEPGRKDERSAEPSRNNPERNPTILDVVQYIPKPKEKWDDRDCKTHNLDNVAKAAIFKTLDPITFSKIKHLKTAMEIWQGLGKLCEGSEDQRKQKIEVLLEKFKSFKMLPGESFDMLDERFHKILNDLASLNHVLSPKEKNVRLVRSLPAEWYTKATTIEEVLGKIL